MQIVQFLLKVLYMCDHTFANTLKLCALPEGYCRCLPDHIPWLGGCEPKRQHGQR